MKVHLLYNITTIRCSHCYPAYDLHVYRPGRELLKTKKAQFWLFMQAARPLALLPVLGAASRALAGTPAPPAAQLGIWASLLQAVLDNQAPPAAQLEVWEGLIRAATANLALLAAPREL